MVISQGEIWWADLSEPVGSAPGFRRPVVVVQSDALNRSRISTVVCVVLTSNVRWSKAPGNVLLPAKATRLEKESVANVTAIVTVNRTQMTEKIGMLSRGLLEQILSGVQLVLGC
jgi:mRNA interferase MazF